MCGLDNITRAIIVMKDHGQKTAAERKAGTPCFQLLIEGTALQAVMGVRGLDGAKATSTHITEVERCLGIEAARNTIVHEIQSVMGNHGMDIDERHVSLLADVMSFRSSSHPTTAHCSLLTADHCLLLTACTRSLLTAYCLLRAAHHCSPLLTTAHSLLTAHYSLLTAHYSLLTTRISGARCSGLRALGCPRCASRSSLSLRLRRRQIIFLRYILSR